MENEYGICHLSLIPLRTQASDKAELCTQLLFGEIYTVLKSGEGTKWLYIENDFDKYTGWMDAGQFYPISQTYLESLKQSKNYVSTDLIGFITGKNEQFPIVLGSNLPFFENKKIRIERSLFQFQGNFREVSANAEAAFILQTALQYLKAPYLWGGKSPFGIDCSGFTQQVFKIAGIPLKRDAYLQAQEGEDVADIKSVQTGDLAFFKRDERIVHVGIVMHKNQLPEMFEKYQITEKEKLIIHALECVRIDKLDEQGIFNLDRKLYTHQLHSFKRFILERSTKSPQNPTKR